MLLSLRTTDEGDDDHDGHISVDDAYAYVFDQVQAAGAAQTPQRWLYGAEGQILLARNPAGPVIIPAPLPESLRAGLGIPHPGIRIGAVTELGAWLASGDPARKATARRHLQEVADADIPRVARTARTLLDTQTTAEPQEAQGQAGLQPEDWARLAAESQPAAHPKTPAESPDPRARTPAAEPELELSTLAVDFGRIRVGSNQNSVASRCSMAATSTCGSPQHPSGSRPSTPATP